MMVLVGAVGVTELCDDTDYLTVRVEPDMIGLVAYPVAFDGATWQL
jgi:hypothetical protein